MGEKVFDIYLWNVEKLIYSGCENIKKTKVNCIIYQSFIPLSNTSDFIFNYSTQYSYFYLFILFIFKSFGLYLKFWRRYLISSQ